MPPIDKAGRQIAGLLTYNPGPGIYSRLERAIQAMPENVRVQELPGLLKRYKDGVPGWELKATDLDSVIAGRDMVPRDELLGAVRERSPVYTHGEVVLGGRPQMEFEPEYYTGETPSKTGWHVPERQSSASSLGDGVSHGEPLYSNYGQGGSDYTELLLTQPNQSGLGFGSHWSGTGKPQDQAVAHARFDTHGDALRINELQSDLGIHNRKAREYAAQNPQIHFGERLNPPETQGLPFPLEDAWADLLIKRMALEAARKGHRAIEVASPRAIADKVGGNIDNYEHFYGKVVPGALERLGRKMGGLVDDSASPSPVGSGYQDARNAAYHRLGINDRRANDLLARAGYGDEAARARGVDIGDASELLQNTAYHHSLRHIPGREHLAGEAPTYMQQVDKDLRTNADALFETLSKTRAREAYGHMPYEDALQQSRFEVAQIMPELMRHAEIGSALLNSRSSLTDLHNAQLQRHSLQPGRRYLMSDEMRRRLIQEGVGAAVAGGLMSQDDLIERLGQ